MEAGLGIKKIKLDLEDEEMAVNETITSDEKDEGGNFKGFPQLKEVGGFEMMNCSPNCRDLKVLNCSRAAKSLRATVGGQSKIYVWFGYLQLIGPQSLGSIVVVSLCVLLLIWV